MKFKIAAVSNAKICRYLQLFLFIFAIEFFVTTNGEARSNDDYRRAGIVKATQLNVRARPGTRYEILYQLTKGDIIEIVDEEDGWLGIIAAEESLAWVALNQLENGVVTGKNTPVFSGPGTLYTAYNQLQTGDRVEILEIKDEKWARIVAPRGSICWVYGNYVEVEEANEPPEISGISDQTTREDVPITGIKFRADEGGRGYEDIQSLKITATSSVPSLIPNDNIIINFTDGKKDADKGTIDIIPATNQNGRSVILLKVSDGEHTIERKFTVNVTPVDDPPVISKISDQITDEDRATTGIAFNVDEGGESDEDTQRIEIKAESSNRKLVPSENIIVNFTDDNTDAIGGTLSIIPAPDQNGEARITLTVDDGNTRVETAFQILVLSINDPPSISGIEDRVVDEDQLFDEITFTIDENVGEDDEILTVKATSSNTTLIPDENIIVQLSKNKKSGATGSIRLKPFPNRNGTAMITLTVSDASNISQEVFTAKVRAVNDSPVLSKIQNQTIDEDTGLSGLAFTADEGGDGDEDGQTLVVSASSSNLELIPNSNLSVNFTDDASDAKGGTLDIKPSSNKSGTATITLTANDGMKTTQQRFTVTVNAVNDPPTISDIPNHRTEEDRPITNIEFIADEGGGEYENDQVVTIKAKSSNTTLIPDSNITINFVDDSSPVMVGTVDITPAPNQNGTAVITLTIDDRLATSQKSFVVEVLPINDPPAITKISDQIIDEDSTINEISFSVDEGGGNDEDTEVLTVTVTSSNSALVGDANIVLRFEDDAGDATGATIEITPAPDQNGHTTITVSVSDGVKSSTTRFTLTVNPVDDPPIISDVPNQTTSENSTIDGISFNADEGGSDDENFQALKITARSSNTTLVPNSNISINFSDDATDAIGGTISITPAQDQNGTTTIILTVSDGNSTAEDKFILDVGGINSAPIISRIQDQSTYEDSSISEIAFAVDEGGGSDEDGQVLEISVSSSNVKLVPDSNIRINFRDDEKDATGGTLSIESLPNQNGSTTITVIVNDGTTTAQESFTLTVHPVNDPPEISSIADQSTTEDIPIDDISFVVHPGGGDDEFDQSVSITATSSNPTLVPDSQILIDYSMGNPEGNIGRMRITPAPAKNGTATITVTVSDGSNIVQEKFNLTVAPVNNPPELSTISDRSTNEDTPLRGIAFTVDEGGGSDEDIQVVSLRVSSSNQDLIPDHNIRVNFSDNANDATGGVIDLDPLPDQAGMSTLTLEASDGTSSVRTSFDVTVRPVNDRPFLSEIEDIELGENELIDGIKFTVDEGGGHDEDVQIIEINVNSSNTSLIPDAGITVDFADDESDAGSGILMVKLTPGQNGESTITVTAGDGTEIVQQRFTVTVKSENDAPTISKIEDQSIDENEIIRGLTFSADEGGGTDEDVQVLSVKAKSSNSYLIATSNIVVNFYDNTADATGGAIDIKPGKDRSGTSVITLIANDGSRITEQSFVVNVGEVNDPPIISGIQDQSTSENTPIIGIKLSIDEGGGADEDVQIINVHARSSNPNLIPDDAITINFSDDTSDATEGTIDIIPVAAMNGVAKITLIVSDGVNMREETFNVRVNAINDAPTVSKIVDQFTEEDKSLTGIPLIVDEGGGPDEDIQTIRVTSSSSNTRLIPNSNIRINLHDTGLDAPDGTIDITPQPHQNGSSTITLIIDDGTNTVQETFRVTVAPVNDIPVISTLDDYSVDEDSSIPGIFFTVDEGGGEDEDSQELMVSVQSSNTTLIPVSQVEIDFSDSGMDATGGSMTVRPAKDQHGTATLTVSVSDGSAAVEESFLVTVNAVNDTPTVSRISNQVMSEDATQLEVAFTVDEGGGADEDSEIINIAVTASNSTLLPEGNVEVEFYDDESDADTGTIVLTPAANQFGTSAIKVSVDDGVHTVYEIFELTVDSANDAPVAFDEVIATQEDRPVTGTLRGEDIDGNPLRFMIVTPASKGTVSVSNPASGVFTYTPHPDKNGNDSFSFNATDGTSTSNTANVIIAIETVNDPPVIEKIANQKLGEDDSLTGLTFTVDEGGGEDEDDQILKISATSSDNNLIPDENIIVDFTDTQGDANKGTISIRSLPDAHGTATITIIVDDGANEATTNFEVFIRASNDPPTISAIENQSINEDTSITDIAFMVDEGGDADEDIEIVKVSASSSNKSLIPDGNIVINFSDDTTDATGGTLEITPAANQHGTSTITLVASDGVNTVRLPFEVTVAPVNDPPVIADIPAQTIEEDNASMGIGFTVDEGGAKDEDSQTLTVTATSSNQALVPDQSIIINFSDGAGDASGGNISLVPAANEHGTAIITVSVSDGQDTAKSNFRLTVTPVNDPPTLSEFKDQTILEDTQITGIQFTGDEGGGTDENAQTLTITAASNNTRLIPDSNIEIDFTDNGDAEQGTISITPAPEEFGVAKITITASDGIQQVQRTFKLKVDAVNDPPEMSTLSDLHTQEDIGITDISFTVDDGAGRDESNQPLHINVSSSNTALVPDEAVQVRLTRDAQGKRQGTINITPANDQSGKTLITLTVNDGTNSIERTFEVLVDSVNDRPTASPGHFSTDEDTPVSGQLEGVDRDGDQLTYEIVDLPKVGTAAVSDPQTGAFTYTPNANANGIDSFSFKTFDGIEHSLPAVISLTINPVDDTPTIARIPGKTVDEDTESINVVIHADEGGGSDEDEQVIHLTATSSNQALIPNTKIIMAASDDWGNAKPAELTVFPTINQSGVAIITITVDDGNSTSTTLFELTVDEVNDAPTIVDIPDQSTREDQGLENIRISVDEGGGSDEDIQFLTISATSSNTDLIPNENIKIEFQDDDGNPDVGSLSLTPAPNSSGTATIVVKVNDGTSTAEDSFEVVVRDTNDAPTASDVSLTGDEDSEVSGNLAAVDPDGDPLIFSIVQSASFGTIEVTEHETGSFIYIPKLNFNGKDSFTFKASDSESDSNIATVTIDVKPVDDLPTITDVPNQLTDEDTPIESIPLIVDEGGGRDEDYQVIHVQAISSNKSLLPDANIVVRLADDGRDATRGSIDIKPAENRSGTTEVTLTASDGTNSVETSFIVDVVSVNDAPVISELADLVAKEDQDIEKIIFSADEGGGEDEDEQILKISATSSRQRIIPDANLVVTFDDDDSDASEGGIKLTPVANQFGETIITLFADDGIELAEKSFVVNVEATNDAPTVENYSVTVEENVPVTAAFRAVDVDDDPLVFRILKTGSKGNVVINEDSPELFTYTPLPNATGSDFFNYAASDGVDESEPATVEVIIDPIENPPTISSIPVQRVDEDTAITGIEFTADEGGGEDEDAQILKVTATSSNPTLVPDKNITINFSDDETDSTGGTIDITPAPDQSGTTEITITVDDGTYRTDSTFGLRVEPLDDLPRLSKVPDQVTKEDTELFGIVFTVDEGGGPDEDLQIVEVSVVSSNQTVVPDNYIVVDFVDGPSDSKGGTIEIQPETNQSGETIITITADDGTGTVTTEFKLTVEPVSDPPVFSEIIDQAVDEDGVIKGVIFHVDEGGGSDEDVEILNVTAKSSNPELIPDSNISVKFSDNDDDARDGTLDIIPVEEANGTAIITLIASDGVNTSERSFNVTINAVDDPPVISDLTDHEGKEDSAITGIAFTVDEGGGPDEDIQALTVTAKSSNTSIVSTDDITVNFSDGAEDATGGTIDVKPTADRSGSAKIVVTVSDGHSTIRNSFVIEVRSTNDSPIAYSYNLSTEPGVAASSILKGNDPDGNPITYAIVQQPSKGTASIVNPRTGVYTYTPGPEANGTDHFTFKVTDGKADSNIATINITIEAEN